MNKEQILQGTGALHLAVIAAVLCRNGICSLTTTAVLAAISGIIAGTIIQKEKANRHLAVFLCRYPLPFLLAVWAVVFAFSYIPDGFWLYEKAEVLAALTLKGTELPLTSPYAMMYFVASAGISAVCTGVFGLLLSILHCPKKIMPVLSGVAAGAAGILLIKPFTAVPSEILCAVCAGFFGMTVSFIRPKTIVHQPLIAVLAYCLESAVLFWLLLQENALAAVLCAGALYIITNLFDGNSLVIRILDRISSCAYETALLAWPVFLLAPALTSVHPIVITLVTAVILTAAVGDTWGKKIAVIKVILLAFVCIPAFNGWRIYSGLEDPTEELKALEERLQENAVITEQMQEQYLQAYRDDQAFLADQDALTEASGVDHWPVSGIGDSVMLGALDTLYAAFDNGDFDAAVSRSHFALYSIAAQRIAEGTLKENVLIGIGTNGPLPYDLCQQIADMCGERKIWWVTTTNNWQFYNTDTIFALAESNENVTVVDWDSASAGHGEYFYADGIHLTPEGRQAYIQCIKQTMAESRKDALLAQRQENRSLLLGGSALLSAADVLALLQPCYMYCTEEQSIQDMIQAVHQLGDAHMLAGHVVIALDGEKEYDAEELKELFDTLADCDVTVIEMPLPQKNITGTDWQSICGENVQMIDLRELFEEHREYFTPDRIHFNAEGSAYFASLLQDVLPH